MATERAETDRIPVTLALSTIGYLEKLREITKKHGIVLIFDEVITAFGRVGGATASGTLGVTPDIITMAKGLTGGYLPLAATV